MIKIIIVLLLAMFISFYLYITFSNNRNLSPILEKFQIEEKEKKYIISSDLKKLNDGDIQYNKINYKTYKFKDKNIIFEKPIYENISKVYLNNNYQDNNKYIPKIIWQTFREEIKEDNRLYDRIKIWKEQKDYQYRFMDDKKGLEFLKENFEEEVWKCFNVLIPGAYKGDLLRVCLIYIHGGIYSDVKVNLKYPLDYFLDKELVLVKDIGLLGIWNGFFAAKPKHPFLKKIIEVIVSRIKNKEYGASTTDITGPRLWGKEFIKYFKTIHFRHTETNYYRMLKLVRYDDKIIITKNNNYEPYLDYNRDYHKHYDNKKHKHYIDLWNQGKVYNEYLHKKYFLN